MPWNGFVKRQVGQAVSAVQAGGVQVDPEAARDGAIQ
jgi:hypothetical protein